MTTQATAKDIRPHRLDRCRLYSLTACALLAVTTLVICFVNNGRPSGTAVVIGAATLFGSGIVAVTAAQFSILEQPPSKSWQLLTSVAQLMIWFWVVAVVALLFAGGDKGWWSWIAFCFASNTSLFFFGASNRHFNPRKTPS